MSPASVVLHDSADGHLPYHPVLDVRPPVRRRRHAREHVLPRREVRVEERFHARRDGRDAAGSASKTLQRLRQVAPLVGPPRALRVERDPAVTETTFGAPVVVSV